MNKGVAAIVVLTGLVTATAASAAPWIAQEADVPIANGKVAIALVKNGDAERTMVCRHTADALVKIRPDGVAFDTSYKNGKKFTTAEVVDTAQIIPVAVNSCTVTQGNHFDDAVAKARTS